MILCFNIYANIERVNNTRATKNRELLAAGYAGLEGTLLLLREKRRDLERRFSKRYLNALEERAATLLDRQTALFPAGSFFTEDKKNGSSGAAMPVVAYGYCEGGVLAGLWEFAEALGSGFSLTLRRLPLLQGTVELCEYFGLTPYRLLSGGAYLLVRGSAEEVRTGSEACRDGKAPDGELGDKENACDENVLIKGIFPDIRSAWILSTEEEIPLVTVGRLTSGNDRLLCYDGQKAYLQKPQPDEIYRIVGEGESVPRNR